MARARITFDDGGMRRRVGRFRGELHREVSREFDREAAWATGYLKATAPWTDDTGAARAGLLAVANDLGRGGHELVMSYSVHYGIYLETMESGRYAVIAPAMRIIGAKVLSDLTGLIDRMQASAR